MRKRNHLQNFFTSYFSQFSWEYFDLLVLDVDSHGTLDIGNLRSAEIFLAERLRGYMLICMHDMTVLFQV